MMTMKMLTRTTMATTTNTDDATEQAALALEETASIMLCYAYAHKLKLHVCSSLWRRATNYKQQPHQPMA